VPVNSRFFPRGGIAFSFDCLCLHYGAATEENGRVCCYDFQSWTTTYKAFLVKHREVCPAYGQKLGVPGQHLCTVFIKYY